MVPVSAFFVLLASFFGYEIMANYDASIRIDAKLNTKSSIVQLERLENRMVKTSDTITSLSAKMDELKDVQIPTQEYSEISSQIEKAEQKLNNLLEKQCQMQQEGRDNGIAWDRLNSQIEETQNEISYAKGELQDLVDTGKAFTLGRDTEEYAKLGQQLKYAENDMAVLNKRHDELIAKQGKASEGYKKLGKTAKQSFDKINKSAKKSGGLLGTMATRFKGLALSLLIFNQISKAFRALTQGIKEGFDNFYKGNESFQNSVDNLKASLLTLKNSFSAAFMPLVQMVIPYIQKAVEWMTALIGKIGQFIAAITGQKTYTKAINQTTAAIKDQNKAQNKQLSSLDKLNNLTSDKGDNADDGSAANMFEEVPIDKGILDFLQKIKNFLKPIIDYAKKLKEVFMQGFWDGLGDWEYRWESIKDSLASIKDSIIDIWTDSAVLAAADKWAQSVAYMLGSLVGSLASIGLTIAANLLGGIAKYLEQNKDRIKQYLISMFDIWAEINMMFAELFQSIAYIFEAFASEQGQQLTANIIGIFTNAFMGITELASKLFRDIAQLIIQPFVDNKEALRTALEGFLGVLASVTGTIKDGIDATFDKLNEVYDTHFKPFFDSIAQGLSDLLGQFLEFWNGNVQPILDQWAADFDELWKSHIQPLLYNVAEFLGKIADLLKVVWENYLQPMIEWIIANVLPKVLPVLQAIWDTLKNLIGYIADAISNVVTILGGLIDFITGVFSGDWEKAFQGLQDAVGGFINLIKTIIEGGLQFISDILNTFFETVKGIVDSLWEAIKSAVTAGINFVKQNIIGKFNEIKVAFSTFKSNVSQIWSNMWNGLKEKVSNIIGGIKEIIKSAVDWIASKIQSILSLFGQINTAARSMTSGALGSAMGGALRGRTTTYSMSPSVNEAMAGLSEIEFPGYATGQVIPRTMRQHLAWLGDNNQETEIVSPLSTMKQAFMEALAETGISGGNSNGGNNVYEFSVDGQVFFRIMEKYAAEYKKQHGGKIAFS